MKTDQADCAYLDVPVEPARPTKPAKPEQNAESGNTRSAIALEDAGSEKLLEEPDTLDVKIDLSSDVYKIIAEPVMLHTVETVPERILKTAEAIKEENGDAESEDKMIIVEMMKEKAVERAKETEKTA